jgi:hypothetical protein
MKTEIKEITPEYAKELLSMNHSNRRIKERVVNLYAKEMIKGEWKLTGESIKVSNKKRLLDGQHRLLAIMKANVSVKMLIIFGLEDDIFNVLDTGSNRNATDVISIRGINNNAGLVGSVCRFVINFNKGIYSSKENTPDTKVTNKDILNFLNENENIIDMSNQLKKDCSKFKLLPLSMLCGMYFVLQKINTLDCDLFFNSFISGLDLKEESPIRIFRERLIRDQINKTRLTYKEKVILFIYAWNNFRKGKSIKGLRIESSYKPIAI